MDPGGQAWTGTGTMCGCVRSASICPGRQLAFDSAYEAMTLTLDPRRDRLDKAIVAMAKDPRVHRPAVHRLGCLRGISTLTGFGLAVEVGDWTRFSGNTIGAFLGLVPTEYSSGVSRGRRAPITKTGNGPRTPAPRRSRVAPPQGPTASAPVYAATRGRCSRRGAGPGPPQGNQRLHEHRWRASPRTAQEARRGERRRGSRFAGWAWSLAVLWTD